MNSIDKPALQAAVLIHEQLATERSGNVPICLPEYSWDSIQRSRRQIELARHRGWHRAVAVLTEDLTNAVENCCRELENALHTLKASSVERRVAPASDIYRDILALQEEFEEVEIDLEQHELCVTTDRITLDDIYLGDFEIRLNWQQLERYQPYRVVALDPHPAAKSEDITHPHVQDEQLCEGEGRSAIHVLLAQGRLYDFFLLVSQVLHTYGRGSAYVELENWLGVPCEECGATINSDDDRYYCHRCDVTLCSSCVSSCHDCGDSYCSSCLSQCADCGCEFCSTCLATCCGCHKRFCTGCLEDGLCDSCRQEKDEDQDHAPAKQARKKSIAVPA